MDTFPGFESFPNVKVGTRTGRDSALIKDSIIRTRSGHMTAKAKRPDGREAFLHSRFDPVKEACSQLDGFKFDFLDTLLVFGSGLGYEVIELCKRIGSGNHLVVVEKDLEFFKEACKNPKFQKVIKRPNTFFFIGIEPDDLYDFLASNLSLFLASGIKFLSHPPSVSIFPDYYKRFFVRIDDFIRTGAVLLRTTMYLSRVSFRNRLQNLEFYLESPGVGAYRGRFAGKPGIVVSAGPSLAKNMELLKKVKGKAPIVAVSTALKSLLGNGIVPDFAVIIDYASLSKRYFEDVQFAVKIPLVCDLKANYGAIKAYQGLKLFDDDELMNVLLGGISAPKGKSGSGSTVAHTAYHFVCYLGCDPVIFIGQDLAYTDGELHVPGTAVYQQSFGEFNRFYSPVMKEFEYYLTMRPRLRNVPAWGGGTVKTCDIFSTYQEEFEGFFRRRPQKVIDATEGGSAKQWTERLTLKETIARYMQHDAQQELFDMPVLSREEKDKFSQAAEKRIKEITKQAGELRRLYDRAIKLVKRVLKENRKGRPADSIVIKVLKIKDELRNYGSLYFVLTQLAQSDLFIRKRTDRELNHKDVSGVEKQQKQAERDLDYLKGLKHALDYLLDEITGCDFVKQYKSKEMEKTLK